ncbi:MAG: succinylglutamate desuccinylase [Hahellaceae bacterium]|nr:succinylglutamate desuccinylase [Hahellaceae bacterium]MCP5168797.1 succinylglutamate desuccinylase [Hahellaceae bacterium]
MHNQTELFDHYRDFLSHTLAHANCDLPAISTVQDNGIVAERVSTGILRLTPTDKQCQKRKVVLSSGVHGDETAPIELCNALVNGILSQQIPLCCDALFIFGNPPAMTQGLRHIDFNLNRLFCGKYRQESYREHVESPRAAIIEKAVSDFAKDAEKLFHLDLHTAIRGSVYEQFALYPYVEDRVLAQTQKQWLEQAGIQAIVLQNKPASTFSAWTAQTFNAESFTLELGSIGPFGKNDLTRLNALRLQLEAYLSNRIPPACEASAARLFSVCHEIIRTSDNFELCVDKASANFTEFPDGSLIWKDSNQQYQVEGDSQYLIFPNPVVPVGQRAGLMLKLINPA